MFDIRLASLHFEAFQLTMNVSNATADNIGDAVTLDTTANNTVKPAEDGDPIFGTLDSYEDRSDQEGIKTGAVSAKVIRELEYEGTAPTIGFGVVGSTTAGKVKSTGAAATAGEAIVTAVHAADSKVEVYVR